MTRVCISICIIIFAITMFGCSDSTDPNTTTGVGYVSGKIISNAKADLEGVTVKIGDLSTITAANGEFLLANVPIGDEVLVDISKPNYIMTHKVIKVRDQRRTHITATLFSALIVTVDSGQFCTITDGPASINIPANSFVDTQGVAFSGTVLVNAKYFDPTDPACIAAFPGEFSGVRLDGTETNFESYGFISARFFSDADPTQELKLAPNTTAEINVPIPASLLSASPSTIPMWYYDDTTGKWREEGVATRVNNYYVGSVNHFTFWNFDHPINVEDEATLTGKVVYADSTAAYGAQVVAMGVNYAGYTTAIASENGDFSIRVKANSQVSLTAKIGDVTSIPMMFITPASGATDSVDNLMIGDMRFTMTGLIKDSSGQALAVSSITIKQYNPPAGAAPFALHFMTTAEGHFTVTDAFGTPGSTIQLQVSWSPFNSSDVEYSNPISFTIPYPGDFYDFGTVNLLPGGIVKGRAQKSTGGYFANTNVYFMQVNSGGEEVYFSAIVDADGYFSITGPPSTSNTNMQGSIYYNEQSWSCPVQTFSFPASGQINNLGTITFAILQDK